MEITKRRKNNRGITLITLIITVLLMLIIASIGINAGIESTDSVKIRKFYDELQLIQTKVDIAYEKLQAGEKTEEELGGELYSSKKTIMDRTFNGLNDETIVREDFKYYTSESIKKYLEVEDVDQSVMINWKTREVISVEGIKINGLRYYRYTEYYRPTDDLDEYQVVEYIESTGTQYIDTEYSIQNTNAYFDIETMWTDGDVPGTIIGQGRYNHANQCFFVGNSNKAYKNYNNPVALNITKNIKYNIIFNKDNKLYVNDFVYNLTGQVYQLNLNKVSLFAQRNLADDGTLLNYNNYAKARLYSAKIYDNNILVRDFIPCYHKSDNVVGMYDLVENKFYANSGTGIFNKGPDIVNDFIGDKDVKITTTTETNGDITKVVVGVTEKENPEVEITDFILKYKLEGENVWKIADSNYFETSILKRYRIQISGNGIQTKEKTVLGEYLPIGYQKVEYIESTGTQYIDTGYSINNTNAYFDIETMWTDGDVMGTIIGQGRDNYANQWFCVGSSNKAYKNYHSPVALNMTKNVKYKIIFNKGNKLYVNDSVYNLTGQVAQLDLNKVSLFAQRYLAADGTFLRYHGYAKARLYSAKIYDNNILVRDFIPCYRKSDNVVGMYDLVEGKFYENEGTNEFLKGEDI